MRLTRRGWTALAVVAFSVAMSWQYGPRALNAVVTPLAVVLVAGVVLTFRFERPTVRRHAVADGPIGERRTVTIDVECERSISATIREAIGDGLALAEDESDGPVADSNLESGTNTVSYDLTLGDRGAHEVGPISITVRDAFGLVERRFEYEETTSVCVYPRPVDLHGGGGHRLRALVESSSSQGRGADLEHEREEFDRLREYRRGDSLRNVHWKSAAKRPDGELFVTEYATDAGRDATVVAAECAPGYDDDLAKALASVVTFLLESELRVGLRTEDDAFRPEAGRSHHRDLLRTIAVLESGELSDRDRDEADVLVTADGTGTRVVVDGRELPFEGLAGSRESESGLEHDASDASGATEVVS
ncbi:DUF58 domain-containing protein [Natronobacterium texcoconense]|uniref:Uncharacterized conserved protein, DUF58 family, contains vWF domain n=1 Tax=Natronobacterium texcoconense TaxID=1095778 RepID=A0A1H1IPN7_NATTX|nr:DUF58 domain-containing protein [Natronobacterium texcoconense]SDR39642.1 Uncharacterized conserved protein, DUF58 family, contains vWF domain [Natronobacterium texcoconense]